MLGLQMNSKQTKGFSLYAIHAPASANPQTRSRNYIYSNIGAAYGVLLREPELICKQYA
jgi:hypothetical protein